MDRFNNFKINCLRISTLLTIISLTGCVDLTGGQMMAGKKKSAHSLSTAQDTANNKKTNTKQKKKLYGEIHALRGGLGIFSLGMNKLQAAVSERYDVPGSSTMWYSGGDVSRSIIDYHYKHHSNRPVILMGHSLGANEQIKVARNLEKAGIPVDLLVTLDAVLPPKVPGNVRHALNLYKPGYVPMFSGIRLKADNPELTRIDNMNVNEIGGVKVNHFTIANNKKVQTIILDEVDKVLTDANRKGA